jgi:hypothetical protein
MLAPRWMVLDILDIAISVEDECAVYDYRDDKGHLQFKTRPNIRLPSG